MSDGVMLHLGCGKRMLPGCVHIDLGDAPHLDYRHDIRKLPMMQDGSVRLIYSSHAFEYFDRIEASEVLGEWRRVLKERGILRLAVPDFRALAELYFEHGNLQLILGPLFGRWEIPGTGQVAYHRTTYDETSLRNLLETAGFRNVRRWDWREVFVGEWAGYDDYSQAYYPHLDRERGKLISLNIEAER